MGTKKDTKTSTPTPELIFSSDGLRTILNVPWECSGCGGMHYFFILTAAGHRCTSCANASANLASDLPSSVKNDKNIGDLKIGGNLL